MTPQDIGVLKYFWQSKGDLECYVDWPELQIALKQDFPHILDAWERYKSAKETLSILISQLDW